MPLTLNGSGGITYPDGSVNTTRSVSTAGDTMTGALNVPANATGTQVPRVQEVVKKTGDTMTGKLTAQTFTNSFLTALTDYRTAPPGASNVLLEGTPNDRDCWIFKDSHSTANFGIYHRNVDTTIAGLPANSIGFVGNNVLNGYIELSGTTSARWGIGSNLVPVSSQGLAPGGAGVSAGEVLWFGAWHSEAQRVSYDRGWNGNPSISVHNTTDRGVQSEFRIHGTPGSNGGDFSVNLVCDGSINGISDARSKTEIANIENALDIVLQLQGRTFKYVNSQLEIQTQTSIAGGRKYGFIAQEAKDIIPENVIKFEGPVTVPNENGYCQEYAMDYASLTALLTEAIKEQQAIINDLKTRIEVLEGVK